MELFSYVFLFGFSAFLAGSSLCLYPTFTLTKSSVFCKTPQRGQCSYQMLIKIKIVLELKVHTVELVVQHFIDGCPVVANLSNFYL